MENNTFPAETPDGVEQVRKDVTADGSAVILTDEDGQVYQPSPLGAAVEATDEPKAMNSSSSSPALEDTTIRDDQSDEVKAVEEAVAEATGTEATLTASEAQSQIQSAEPVAEASPEEAADAVANEEPAEEPAPEVEATPAAEELAASEGVDLAEVEGSGVDGKIVKSDVEAAAASDEA